MRQSYGAVFVKASNVRYYYTVLHFLFWTEMGRCYHKRGLANYKEYLKQSLVLSCKSLLFYGS